MNHPECKDIVNVILPAVRASIAETMRKKYGYKQEEIARHIGVVQVAVSKYLGGKHSEEIESLKNYIIEHKLNEEIVRKLVAGGPSKITDTEIDALCEKLVAVDLA